MNRSWNRGVLLLAGGAILLAAEPVPGADFFAGRTPASLLPDFGYRHRPAPSAPAPKAGPEPIDTSAAITVRAPAHAELWFEGKKTATTGSVRQFLSPPLTPGHEYVYEVWARWQEKGREVEQARIVRVHAGDQVNVSFPVPVVPVKQPKMDRRPASWDWSLGAAPGKPIESPQAP
jgi:uncharacterized protein (TIGR03000 family)